MAHLIHLWHERNGWSHRVLPLISEVLDYEYLVAVLDETLNLQRASLLETLANRLLDRILKPHSVEAATVVITKLDVLDGDGQLGCSITRIK